MVVLVTGEAKTVNGLLLVTPPTVRFPGPSLYTIVYGPLPAVAVQVNVPAPDPQKGPFAVKVPCGKGLTVTAKVRAVPLPHKFEGVTVMLPEVAPTVAMMVLVVPPLV